MSSLNHGNTPVPGASVTLLFHRPAGTYLPGQITQATVVDCNEIRAGELIGVVISGEFWIGIYTPLTPANRARLETSNGPLAFSTAEALLLKL